MSLRLGWESLSLFMGFIRQEVKEVIALIEEINHLITKNNKQ